MPVTIRRLSRLIIERMNQNERFVCRQVAPQSDVLEAEEMTDYRMKAKVLRVTGENMIGLPADRSLKVGPFAEAPQAESELDEDTIAIERRRVKHKLTPGRFRNWQKRGLRNSEERVLVPILERSILVSEEKDLAALMTGASITQATANTDAAKTWDNPSFDPSEHFNNIFDTMDLAFGHAPDCCVCTLDVLDALRSNPNMSAKLRDIDFGTLTMAQLGELLRDELLKLAPSIFNSAGTDFKVVVPLAIKNSANAGLTPVKARIWGTGFWAIARPEVDGSGMTNVEADGALKTFVAPDPTDDSTDMRVIQYKTDEHDEAISYEGKIWSSPTLVNPAAVYRYTGITNAALA